MHDRWCLQCFGKKPLGNQYEYPDKSIMDWTGLEDVEWITVAQDRDHWLAVVYTVMSLSVSGNVGNSFSC
jgi:hypothetical protein